MKTDNVYIALAAMPIQSHPVFTELLINRPHKRKRKQLECQGTVNF